MTKEPSQDLEKLADALEECNIDKTVPSNIILNEICDASLLAKFPKPKPKVPPIFLHGPIKIAQYVRKILGLGIKFYQPIIGHHYTKICCKTYDDHKALIQFFDKRELPFHTFGNYKKRKMKVVIRGLAKDVDLQHLKKELKAASIAIVRIHKMENGEHTKDLPLLVLAVVSNNEKGRKILQIQKIFGHDVKLEPPKPRNMQCYLCQKWGHSQRYCHGHAKCVKCGGDHLSANCTRDPSIEPPKCANCKGEHTSNYKLCPYSPNSPQYLKKMTMSNLGKTMFPSVNALPRKLVTMQNCNQSVIIREKRV